jgi:hypothetical protein
VTTYLSTADIAFSLQPTNGSYYTTISVSPVSYEVKILTLEYSMRNSLSTTGSGPAAWGYPQLYRYNSGTASGGSSLTPAPLRNGTAAASTTSRQGNNVSISGTQLFLGETSYVGAVNVYPQAGNYTFPADVTVSPGSVFALSIRIGAADGQSSSSTVSGSIRLKVYFEELRLSWPY